MSCEFFRKKNTSVNNVLVYMNKFTMIVCTFPNSRCVKFNFSR